MSRMLRWQRDHHPLLTFDPFPQNLLATLAYRDCIIQRILIGGANDMNSIAWRDINNIVGES